MVTLKELSQLLNVSISTVSKSLKNSPEISVETIERVQKLAKELNYRPNTRALSLKNRRSGNIGVIIPDITNAFFAKVLYGIEEAATSHGYNIITCLSNERRDKEVNSINLLSNGSVDGFILAVAEETQATTDVSHFKELLSQRIPIVMFDRVSMSVNCDKVIIDDYNAAYQATQLLIEEGRKSIVLFDNLGELSVAKLRVLGYKKAIDESTQYDAEPCVVSVDSHKDHMYQDVVQLFNDHQNMDGLLCIDNSSGVKAIHYAQSIGIKIPEALSVMGFASSDVHALAHPELSTVTQNADEIGRKSVATLVDRLKENGMSNYSHSIATHTVSFNLVKRGSTL
ncbi:MAG: LacI family DNA-binding transcriptional regulator [Nonlabens sp.]